ncbi:MAG: hypothetical protein MHM6MM_005868 [Cercozoa sp. M6MM]
MTTKQTFESVLANILADAEAPRGGAVSSKAAPILSKAKKLENLELRQRQREAREARARRAQLKAFRNKDHAEVDIAYNAAEERELRKIATKGVVTLFNALRQHKRRMKNALANAGQSEVRRAQAEKEGREAFMQMLQQRQGKKKDDAESQPAHDDDNDDDNDSINNNDNNNNVDVDVDDEDEDFSSSEDDEQENESEQEFEAED